MMNAWQALSYATLAKMPPVSGLYSVILPSVAYIFLGTSMQLGVGPVALVSLLTGSLLDKYKIDYANDETAGTDKQTEIVEGITSLIYKLH